MLSANARNAALSGGLGAAKPQGSIISGAGLQTAIGKTLIN